MQKVPVIDQEFLPLRAKLLEIGAALDRLDRAGALHGREPRAGKIRAAIETLLADGSDRAEGIQLVFSRPYEEDWRERFQMTNCK
jgi:hypothetical protein